MPSYLREPSGSVCWNCDRRADAVVTVTLRAVSGRETAVPLCRACHASTYLPLAAAEPDVLPATGPGTTVLVVDDDPDIRSAVRDALEDEGYAVQEAANGLEALHRACRWMPDLVILDLRMPTMDGHAFIAAWRQAHADASAPLVAISAHARRPTAEALGAAAFLPKPFDLDVLVGTVGRLLAAPA